MSEATKANGPGETLRSVRRSHGWTLAEIAARADIPLSTLSKIEIGQISPTYEQLMRLSTSLNMDIAELFTRRGKEAVGASTGGRRSINRLNDGEVIETPSRLQCYLSTDLLKKKVTPIMSVVKARTLEEFGEFMYHRGEEFLYVIEGQLELHTDCYAPVILQTGESIYFESAMGHAYVAHDCDSCRFLCICTDESEMPADASLHAPGMAPQGVAAPARAALKPDTAPVEPRRPFRRTAASGATLTRPRRRPAAR